MKQKNVFVFFVFFVSVAITYFSLAQENVSKIPSNSLIKQHAFLISPAVIPVISESKVISETVVRKVERSSKLEAEIFSKISVSEGGFSHIESKAILQALEDMRSGRSLLETMYGQSPHVSKRKPFTDPRQVWVSNLPMHGSEVPTGWIECIVENGQKSPKGCSGNWKSTSKSWEAFRSYATGLYWSGEIPNVVDGVIAQWGGDMDYWRGAGRNLCPLKSTETKNTYWGFPQKNVGKCLEIDQKKVEKSRVLTAQVAAGRAARRHLILN
jgi:hypothetical protein